MGHTSKSVGDLVDTLRRDFARNETIGQRLTVVVFRVGQFCHENPRLLARTVKPLWRLADVLYLKLLVHAELPPGFECGPGLSLPHAGRGVVVHRGARVGENSMIFHRVTIGDQGGAPSLGSNVYVGSGACLLGPIRVGEYARVGANAVVVEDVPAWATVGGVPAKVLQIRDPPISHLDPADSRG